MNDAEFCSDAHRQSYGEEQLLAMQRLVETASPLQRTQRVASYAGPVLAGQNRGTAAAASGPSMTFIGPLFPDPPAAIPGLELKIPANPAVSGAIVLFRDREHQFQAQLPAPRRIFPIQIRAATPGAVAVSTHGQISGLRVALPRDLASRTRRLGRWTSFLVPTLSKIVPPLPVQAPLASLPEKSTAGYDAYDLSHRTLHRPLCRRVRHLPTALEPIPLSLDASGTEARARLFPSVEAPSAPNPHGQLTYPVAPRLAVSLATAFPEQKFHEQLWTALDATPLGALLSAVGYTSIAPVGSALSPVAGTAEIPFAPPAQPPAARLRPLNRGDLSAARELRTVAAPAPAAIALDFRLSAQTLLPAAMEQPAAGRLPGHQPRPVAPADLPVSTQLQGLSVPAPALARAFHPVPTETLDARPAYRIPVHSQATLRRSLSAQAAVLPVAPPAGNAGVIAALWSATWATHASNNAVPASKTVPRRTIASASGVAVPPPAPSGSPRPLRFGNTGGVPVWTPGESAMARPAGRFAAMGERVELAGRVPCRLTPKIAAGQRTPLGPQRLHTVLRHRFPVQAISVARRYGSAECIAIHPPPPAPLRWRAVTVAHADLSPNTVLPGAAKLSRPRSLRTLPARLYRVPNARPMARPCGGKPLAYSMGEWASRPAISTLNLEWDDGKPRQDKQARAKFGRDVLERFSTRGIRDLWTKTSHLPSDLKWIAMVVPLIIGIWVLARPTTAEPISGTIPNNPAIQQPAADETKDNQLAGVRPLSRPETETEPSAPAEKSKPVAKPKELKPAAVPPAEMSRWDILKARIAGRASVNLVEDFRNGLSLWEGRGEWARTWTYDRSGVVRPGHLAVFQPTVRLRDYVFEMNASIERRSIQWVVRAANPQNYHFARLNVTPGAPLTRLELERWTVINGRVGRVTRLPLPHGGANQTLYAIRIEVHGDSITTYLGDQVIDTFSDARLPDGGVGLLGGPDDRPRIYGIRVSHQNDFLGKLCSFFATQPINTQGSD